MKRTVWSAGGCSSWYLDAHGRNVTLWPRTTFTFRRLTRRFDVEQYVVRHTDSARSTTTTKVGQTA
jgi:cyclohexanone monooxygenase